MAVKITNNDNTKNYIVSEIKDEYRPNLLINGDFQCWQRGSQLNLPSGNALKYTADMWNTNNSKVQMVRTGSGLRFVSSADNMLWIKQICKNIANDKNYICIFSINNVRYVERFKGNLRVENGRFCFNEQVKNVQIKLLPDETLNYVDLFEGIEEHPHIKEDYGIALQRCMMYIQEIRTVCPYMHFYSNVNAYMLKVYFVQEMMDNPTVKITAETFTTNSGGNIEINNGFKRNNEVNRFGITSYPIFSSKLRPEITNSFKVIGIASCEPL